MRFKALPPKWRDNQTLGSVSVVTHYQGCYILGGARQALSEEPRLVLNSLTFKVGDFGDWAIAQSMTCLYVARSYTGKLIEARPHTPAARATLIQATGLAGKRVLYERLSSFAKNTVCGIRFASSNPCENIEPETQRCYNLEANASGLS
ncbi:hypothetical protein J1614_009682 [Plenodomus biglobosus]|nr:hypothetical protein J1614_009682 [Plenodomus biglobosus]